MKGFELQKRWNALLSVLHLLFVDDNVLLCGGALKRVLRSSRCTLLHFQYVFIMSINFTKGEIMARPDVEVNDHLFRVMGSVFFLPLIWFALRFFIKLNGIWNGVSEHFENRLDS